VRWLAVANPAAGRDHEVEGVSAALQRAGGIAESVVRTDGPGSATRIAREAASFDGLIVVGGDGTISECLGGMDLPRQALAVIPAGHGNCLGRDLGLSSPEAALAALRKPRWQALDLMVVTVTLPGAAAVRRLCASTVSVGHVTDIVRTGRGRLAALGHAAYAVAALLTGPRRIRVSHAGIDPALADVPRLTGVVVNNTRHLANFHAFPAARLDDGRLDVMVLDCGRLRQLLHDCAVLLGSEAFGPRAMRQSQRVELRFDAPQTVMADGELFHGATGVEVTCRPSAVRCVAGPQ
jgi:diacylglycerol kinase family enzyme